MSSREFDLRNIKPVLVKVKHYPHSCPAGLTLNLGDFAYMIKFWRFRLSYYNVLPNLQAFIVLHDYPVKSLQCYIFDRRRICIQRSCRSDLAHFQAVPAAQLEPQQKISLR